MTSTRRATTAAAAMLAIVLAVCAGTVSKAAGSAATVNISVA
jgi:hypothetical protein